MLNERTQVKFEVSGGIGNLLFQYSAAKYFESQYKLDLIFAHKIENDTKDNYAATISKLFNTEILRIDKPTRNILGRILTKIDRKLTRLIKIYSRIRKIYTASEVGFIQVVPDFGQYKTIRGYFQSYLYAEYSREAIIKSLNQSSSTSWTKSKILEAEEIKPIAVHIRRGDYINHAARYGLLGEEYYMNALSKIVETVGDRAVWIFSDGNDPVLESKINEKYKSTVIHKPINSDDLEVLLVMSNCFAHVIANSTYSWWAAFLSESTQQVYAPEPWTISGINPKALIPPYWKTVNSMWLGNLQPTKS